MSLVLTHANAMCHDLPNDSLITQLEPQWLSAMPSKAWYTKREKKNSCYIMKTEMIPSSSTNVS